MLILLAVLPALHGGGVPVELRLTFFLAGGPSGL